LRNPALCPIPYGIDLEHKPSCFKGVAAMVPDKGKKPARQPSLSTLPYLSEVGSHVKKKHYGRYYMVKVTTISGVGVGEGAIEFIASCRTGWTEKFSWFYNEALKRIRMKGSRRPLSLSCQGLPAWHARVRTVGVICCWVTGSWPVQAPHWAAGCRRIREW
jgi:hypothetical protein